MRSFSLLKGIGVFLLLVVLHYTVRPLLGTRVSVDFLVIALLLAAVHVRPGAAALIGFVTGVIADSLTPLSFGAGALAMSAVASAASWLKSTVFGDNMLLQAIFIRGRQVGLRHRVPRG
jgi:rod shape-determining protein MreD